jgi:hypothetical protein
MARDQGKYTTTNYDLFKFHDLTREIREGTQKFAELEASMLKWGWWASDPMLVYPRGRDGKHVIVKGHHRYLIAKKHGLKIMYEIDEQRVPLPEREDSGGRPTWSLSDWVYSHLKAGKNPNYQVLYEYQKRTKIPMSSCLALFMVGAGYTVMNWTKDIRRGDLRINDTLLAEKVESIVNLCASNNIAFARKSGFVRALSLIVRFKVVDLDLLKARISSHVVLLRRKEHIQDYLAILNEVYNYRAYPKSDLATAIKNAMAEDRKRINVAASGKAKRSRGERGEFVKSTAAAGAQ